MIPLRETPQAVTFAVKIQPRARKDAITGASGDALKISLTAPPVEGRANEALIRFLANFFDIPRSSVTIASGETSRLKLVRIGGMSSEQILHRLETLNNIIKPRRRNVRPEQSTADSPLRSESQT